MNAMKTKNKGLFISFEGGEGVGKTTQIAQLAKEFESGGRKVLVTREPGGTKIANRIRSVLLDPELEGLVPLAELFLYEASRAQHVQELIVPALAEGCVVICDRFTDSSLIYQGVARGLSAKIVSELNRLATSNLKPNLTIILDLNPQIGLARVGKRGILDRIEKEALEFHIAVRGGFKRLATKEPRRCVIVDASQSREQIHVDILKILHKRKYL
jgi:dTMP kinase